MKKQGKELPKIEKGVPIPLRKGSYHGVSAAALVKRLQPDESISLAVSQGTAYSAARVLGAGNYAIRKEKNGNHRIWRIK